MIGVRRLIYGRCCVMTLRTGVSTLMQLTLLRSLRSPMLRSRLRRRQTDQGRTTEEMELAKVSPDSTKAQIYPDLNKRCVSEPAETALSKTPMMAPHC